MRTKELKNLAKKIAKYELIIQNGSDADAVKEAENAIIALSGQVQSLADIDAIDEYVREILSKNS